MVARLREIALAVLVVAPAVLLVPTGPAGGQSTPPACPQGNLGILDVSVTGELIDDGVGYGGVRIGDAESAFRAAWGPTICGTGPQGTAYLYAVMRSSDQAVEMAAVHVLAGHVVAMVFLPAPHAGVDRMIGLRTRQGVRVGMTLADVERGYGPADAQSFAAVRYRARGVGFIHRESYVMGVAIFAPGTSPNLERMWPYYSPSFRNRGDLAPTRDPNPATVEESDS